MGGRTWAQPGLSSKEMAAIGKVNSNQLQGIEEKEVFIEVIGGAGSYPEEVWKSIATILGDAGIKLDAAPPEGPLREYEWREQEVGSESKRVANSIQIKLRCLEEAVHVHTTLHGKRIKVGGVNKTLDVSNPDSLAAKAKNRIRRGALRPPPAA